MRKRQALKFTHWSHFPCGPGVPHESCEDSSRRAPKRRRRLLTRPRLRQRWAAPLNRAALDAARGRRGADQSSLVRTLQHLDAIDA